MIETSLIFAMGIPPAGWHQSQHLGAEDSAKTALLYMQFEIVITPRVAIAPGIALLPNLLALANAVIGRLRFDVA
jgi:hypothetical protein